MIDESLKRGLGLKLKIIISTTTFNYKYLYKIINSMPNPTRSAFVKVKS